MNWSSGTSTRAGLLRLAVTAQDRTITAMNNRKPTRASLANIVFNAPCIFLQDSRGRLQQAGLVNAWLMVQPKSLIFVMFFAGGRAKSAGVGFARFPTLASSKAT